MPQEMHDGELKWRWVCQEHSCYESGVKEFQNCAKHGGNKTKDKNGCFSFP